MFRAGSAVGAGEQLPVPLDSVTVHSTMVWYSSVTVPVGVRPVCSILGLTLTLKTTFCSLPNVVTGLLIESLVSDGHGLAHVTGVLAWAAPNAAPLMPAARHAEAKIATPNLASMNRIEPAERMINLPVETYQ